MTNEAYRLILEYNILPIDIDKIIYEFGMAMGIFAVLDLSGLDIGVKVRENKSFNYNKVGGKEYFNELPDILVKKNNRKGLKTGKGIYDYPNMKTRKPVSSKLVNDLIIKIGNDKSIKRKNNFNKNDILNRLFYPMINEGIKILEEKIAIRPSDIDIKFVFGYDFPAYRGGLMNYGDLIGMKKIRDELNKLYKETNVHYFKPAKLLNKLADNKLSLNKYWRK